MKIPQIKIKEETIYDNWRRKILLKTFQTSDWTQKEVPISWWAKSSSATITLVLDSKNNIYYWKEYRDWPEIFVNNFSAWKHEEGLSFEENALKELHEEMWITIANVSYLWETIVAAYENTSLKYFIATESEFWSQNLEPWENFEIQSCTIEEFEQKIISWEINCPHTITCYTKAKLQNKL